MKLTGVFFFYLLFGAFFFDSYIWGAAKIDRGYFSENFGHLHQNPSKYSSSITVVTCKQPIQILADKKKQHLNESLWRYVKIGPYRGYILKRYISKTKSKLHCFQEKYSKFFDSLEMKISDFHYWGLLFDHYIHGKSEVK